MAINKGKEQMKSWEKHISLGPSCQSNEEHVFISVGNHKSFVNRTDQSSLTF